MLPYSTIPVSVCKGETQSVTMLPYSTIPASVCKGETQSVTMLPYSTIPVSVCKGETQSVTMLPYSTIPVSVCKGETQCHHATLLYNSCLCLQGRNTVSPCYPTLQSLSLSAREKHSVTMLPYSTNPVSLSANRNPET